MLFSDEEAIAMVVGLQAAAGAAIEGIEEVTVQVMAKLDQILPDRLRRRVDALRSSVETMRWSPSTEARLPAGHGRHGLIVRSAQPISSGAWV